MPRRETLVEKMRAPGRRWPALAATLLLAVALAPASALAQCSSGEPAASVPVNPYDGAVEGSGAGKTIGYISLGDSLPFVKLVSDSIAEQARIAGATLVACDSKVDQAEALACAQQMKVQGAQAVL